MIANYVKTSLRKFRRTKTHTFINVAGLTLGFLCAAIIFQKVRYELSFNQHYPDKELIYRIVHEDNEFGETDYHRGIQYPFAEAFRNDFPDVEHVTLVDRNFAQPVISILDPNDQIKRFKEEEPVGFVDADYFAIFNPTWVYGNPETAFAQPFSAVLSESLALKYFGQTNAVGQTLRFNNAFDLTVTGIIQDPPHTTTMPLKMLMSHALGEEHNRINDNWGSVSSSVQNYVKLAPNASRSNIDRRLHDFLAKYRSEDVAARTRYFLQPLTDIHFDTRFGSDGSGGPVAKETLWILSLIGVFLLLTACINFVNLNTVLVFKRAREVGVRKVLGGTPGQIMAYFMTETALATLIALVLALILAPPVVEVTRSFLGENFAVNALDDPVLLLFALGAAVILSILSGLYPAYLLSRVQPSEAMRSTSGQKPGAFLSLRRSLVVLQFAISQVLIITTVAAVLQMRYLADVPLGYNTEAVVEFAIPERNGDTIRTLENEMVRSSEIQHVTFSNSGATSSNTWGSNFYYYLGEERLENNTQVKLVDTDYVDTYQMTLLAGENFDPNRTYSSSDSTTSYIVNEALVRIMGLSDPSEAVGIRLETWGIDGVIIGVLQDFNTNSLHSEIEPTVLRPTLDFAYIGAARVNTARLDEALAAVEASWTNAFPEYVFEYDFLDDTIEQFYEDEAAMQNLIQSFALVAILIGCIGLFGLISYTTSQRAKEVGIRKVLGASTGTIVTLFTREFVVLVLVGFAVSVPAAYYLISKWLEDFAYRIEVGPGLYATGFVISLLIALTTVAFKTYRAATANPVDAIRAEG